MIHLSTFLKLFWPYSIYYIRRDSGSETHGEVTRASLNRPVANVLKARIRLKFLDSTKEASTQSYTPGPAAHIDTPNRHTQTHPTGLNTVCLLSPAC